MNPGNGTGDPAVAVPGVGVPIPVVLTNGEAVVVEVVAPGPPRSTTPVPNIRLYASSIAADGSNFVITPGGGLVVAGGAVVGGAPVVIGTHLPSVVL